MKRSISAVLLSFAVISTASAQVAVKEPWVRATVPAQKATGAFMQINAAKGARLVEARSPVAGLVEINVMKMRAIPGLDLPAGKSVDLKPGGYHVMLMDLKGQIKEGDSVPITLVMEGADKKRSTIEVKAPARPLAGASADKKHGH
jgi:copper(I)-binding protein